MNTLKIPSDVWICDSSGARLPAMVIGGELDAKRNEVVYSLALMPPLEWTEESDADNNTIWEAQSPYFVDDEGSPLKWRLVPVLEADMIRWRDAHDGELLAPEMQCVHDTLEAAKDSVQELHSAAMKDARASHLGC